MFTKFFEQNSNDSLLSKIYNEMIWPMRDTMLVDNYTTSLVMTEASEFHVTMISGSGFRNRVKVSNDVTCL